MLPCSGLVGGVATRPVAPLVRGGFVAACGLGCACPSLNIQGFLSDNPRGVLAGLEIWRIENKVVEAVPKASAAVVALAGRLLPPRP